MPRTRIHITGKVQGVFFRHSAKEQAIRLRINGWVKNLPDGSVLCEAVGDQLAIHKFVTWCKSGPPRAEVLDISVEILDDSELYSDFEIIH